MAHQNATAGVVPDAVKKHKTTDQYISDFIDREPWKLIDVQELGESILITQAQPLGYNKGTMQRDMAIHKASGMVTAISVIVVSSEIYSEKDPNNPDKTVWRYRIPTLRPSA